MKTVSNPKRTQILSTGKELFWKFGFKRVTIEEICREAAVSKMTFYKFFENKQELAVHIMDEVFDESLLKIRKIDEEHESAETTFKKFLQLKSEGSRDISEEFIKDLYTNPDPGLKTYMEKKTKFMLEEIQKVYENGKETGWVRKDLNIPFLILFSQKLVSLTNDKEMMHFFDSSQDLIMEVTNLIIYGISPHD